MKTMASVAGNFPTPLVWVVWPGASAGNYTLYEDDGDANAYQGGEFVTTAAAFTGGDGNDNSFTLAVAGAVSAGALPTGFPLTRAHSLQLRGVVAAGRTVSSVSCNGALNKDFWHLSSGEDSLAESSGALVVTCPAVSSFAVARIVVVFA